MFFFKNSKFSSLEEALIRPENCKKLELMFFDRSLANQGENFLEFKNLETLCIQAHPSIYYLNDFEIPKEIAQLRHLKKISLLNLPLSSFPEWITNIHSLEYLMIRGTDLSSIPESIVVLNKLKTLRIENCPLAALPDTFNQMHNLKILGLEDTKLTNLNFHIFPKNLKEINLSGTGIYKMAELEKLKIFMKKTKIYP